VSSSIPAILRRLLAAPLPGLDAQVRMSPQPRLPWDPRSSGRLRDAAALILLYPHDGQWWLPLTVRGSWMRQHQGQVSLPGGRLSEGESVEQAALREACEEVGLGAGEVELLGRLTPIPIPVSGHMLHPVVGYAPNRPQFRVAEEEVERLIEAPLRQLRDPASVRWQERTRDRPPRDVIQVPYFDVEGAHVWGATAMVLAEFLALLDGLEPERGALGPAAESQ
jgi:8-oxo-dGTP pyrophosphatase MutT (NUDIX family)